MSTSFTYDIEFASTVMYNDEIYIVGGSSSDNSSVVGKTLRKFTIKNVFGFSNAKWISASTLPYDFYYGSTVVVKDEIHILGGGPSSNRTYHYKWNGKEWTEVSTLPYTFYYSSAVVLNDEIHILGSYDDTYSQYHYKWDGSSWTEVSTLPHAFYQCSAIVYHDEIHILGSKSYSYYTDHYKWDGTSWIKVSTLPYNYYGGSAVVYNDEIHILGNSYDSSYYKYHYKWNGMSWSKVSTLPYQFYYGGALAYNDEIHIFGSGYSGCAKNHYKWDGKSWIEMEWLPYGSYSSSFVVFDNEIHFIGNTYTGRNRLHYKLEVEIKIIQPPLPSCALSVYRREFDGDFTKIATGIKNGSNTYVIDPHPALDFARYRIVAIDNKTGAVSYNDPPGYPVGEKAIIIQWDEKWSNFDVDPDNEDALSTPPWTGSLLKLPYNIDVSDSNETDVSLVEYIGRKHPVSYYGTQRGETASWSVDIPKYDKYTLYALRRLRVYMGDVYVREPSGSGYWARIKVSFSQTHCETVIPVSIDITRVEGGK